MGNYCQESKERQNDLRKELRQHVKDCSTSEFAALHRSTVDFGIGAIKGAMLLNGGGAVALLSFMATSQAARNADLIGTLRLFVYGALAACLTFGISYIAQTFFTFESGYKWAHILRPNGDDGKKEVRCKWGGTVFQGLACLLFLLSLTLFSYGCFDAHDALQIINVP